MPNVTPVSTIQSSSPFHAVTMQEVMISTDLNDREIYKQGGGFVGGKWTDGYALTSVGLSKLMNAAGIEEVRSQRTDDRSDPYLCEWQFVAKWVQPDSTTLTCSENYEFDVRDWVYLGNGHKVYSARFAESVYSERAALMEKEYPVLRDMKGEAKAAKSDQLFSGLDEEKKREITELAEGKALRSLVQPRKFVVQRAQTGAMLRAIRKMLNLKQSYSLQELKEPFRIPRSRYDWERMDAVLGKQVGSDLRQLQALKLLGIAPEEFQKFRQIAAPQPLPPDALEGVFHEAKVEVVDSELPLPEQPVAQKPETTTLAVDEMDFLGKVVKKTDKILDAASQPEVKNWITKYIVGAFEAKKHYLNHIKDHFGVESAINLTYEQIWSLYLHKHKGNEYPEQWAGKKKPKVKAPPTGTSDLAKRIDELEMGSFYAYLQNQTGLGNIDTDEKAAQIMSDLCDAVKNGVYTIGKDEDEKEMLETVKSLWK